MAEIKRKPVAFNVEDPDQKKLYDHCRQRTNFSYYIKTLILRDLEGTQVSVKPVQQFEEESPEILDISSFI